MKDSRKNSADFLKQIHSNLTTPDEIVIQAVKDATGKLHISKKRIIAGELNEVYQVALADGRFVIVRISHNGSGVFGREQWAINKCREKGISIPHVLLVKDYILDGAAYSVCVQERMSGEPLERGEFDYTTMDTEDLRKIMQQAGKILSQIHTISTKGFGYLDANGVGEFKTSRDFLSEHLSQEQQELYLKLAKEVNFGEQEMKNIFTILVRESKRSYQSVLNHNDYAPKHIMVEDGQVTGIIDWGEASGNSPIADFFTYSFWYPNIPWEWLKEGYENKEIFEDDFEKKLYALSLNKALGTLWHYYDTKSQYGLDLVKPRLLKLLAEYNEA